MDEKTPQNNTVEKNEAGKDTIGRIVRRAYRTDKGYRLTNDSNGSLTEPGMIMFEQTEEGWRVKRDLISIGTLIQERPFNAPPKGKWPVYKVQGVQTAPHELYADIVQVCMEQKKGCLGFLRKQPPLAEYVYNELERLSKK